MQCTIQYASDYPVIWMKLDPDDRNNDLPITTGTTLILHDPRFHIDLNKESSTYTLTSVYRHLFTAFVNVTYFPHFCDMFSLRSGSATSRRPTAPPTSARC